MGSLFFLPDYPPKFEGRYAVIPERIQQGLTRWVMEGIPPVEYSLQCMLQNKFMGALLYCDEDVRAVIYEIAVWMHWEIPSACHGSPEIYEKWQKSAEEFHASREVKTHDAAAPVEQ